MQKKVLRRLVCNVCNGTPVIHRHFPLCCEQCVRPHHSNHCPHLGVCKISAFSFCVLSFSYQKIQGLKSNAILSFPPWTGGSFSELFSLFAEGGWRIYSCLHRASALDKCREKEWSKAEREMPLFPRVLDRSEFACYKWAVVQWGQQFTS